MSNWKKSSYSAQNVNHVNCVEVEIGGKDVAVRDSKNTFGPHLFFTHDEWKAFIKGVKAGEFDL